MSSIERASKALAEASKPAKRADAPAGKPRRKKPQKDVTLPSLKDLGLTTDAARAGVVVEDAKWYDAEKGEYVNPNGVKRARRVCWAEIYHDQGKLTKRQLTAALALLDAYEGTQRTPPAIKPVQVDTSPKPDAHTNIVVDRASKYHAVAKHIPSYARPVVDFVVLGNRPIRSMPGVKGGPAADRQMKRLARGLDVVADGISER